MLLMKLAAAASWRSFHSDGRSLDNDQIGSGSSLARQWGKDDMDVNGGPNEHR